MGSAPIRGTPVPDALLKRLKEPVRRLPQAQRWAGSAPVAGHPASVGFLIVGCGG
jgi:hypothetical protein